MALSPFAPVGPVRQFDPARGVSFDSPVLLGGGLLLTVVLLALSALLAWRALRSVRGDSGRPRPSALAQVAVSAGLPTTAALGIRYAVQPAPGRQRGSVRANLIGSIVAVTAVITAAVFGASLNGLVSHPVRYGWNWNVLIQSQGGYGDWYGYNMDKLMAHQPDVRGWSTFAFTQLAIDGQSIPVLGSPPTVSRSNHRRSAAGLSTAETRSSSGTPASGNSASASVTRCWSGRVPPGPASEDRGRRHPSVHRGVVGGPRVARTRRHAPRVHAAVIEDFFVAH